MMTTFSRHAADWEGEAYGPLVSVPQVEDIPKMLTFLNTPDHDAHQYVCACSHTRPSMLPLQRGQVALPFGKRCIEHPGA